MCFCKMGQKKKKVLSLVFFSRAEWDWQQEGYWSSKRWNQDKEKTLNRVSKTSTQPKNLKSHSFSRRFALSFILPGQVVERYTLRRYPASEWAPGESQEGLKCGKRGLESFHGTVVRKCRSALRNILSIVWGSHGRGDVRRNHAWLNTKSTQRNEI